MEEAHVYLLADRLLVCPLRRTTAGLSVTCEPYSVLSTDVDAATLGQAAQRALTASSSVVAHPKDWKAHARARLDAAGVKSERAFQSGARLVTVRTNGSKVVIEPSHNGGVLDASKGFSELPEAAMKLEPSTSDAAMGKAIREAFNLCTP